MIGGNLELKFCGELNTEKAMPRRSCGQKKCGTIVINVFEDPHPGC